MATATPGPTGAPRRRVATTPASLAIAPLCGLALLTVGCGSAAVGEAPAQPIAFNHQKHVVEAEMACTQCHRGAESQDQAGLVPLAACATCHRAIIPDHPEVAKILAHLENDEPVMWQQVNVIPRAAMVHFKHKPHARAGVECAACHGDVGQMTVARRVVDVASMSWCLDCHLEQGASVDCLACHH